MLNRKPFRRIGRMPIRRTLVSVQVDYYGVEPQDRVRLCELCDDNILLSGWPRAGIGGQRPREASFLLDDATAQSLVDMIANLKVCPLLSPDWDGSVIEEVKIEFGQYDAISKFFWKHSAPKEWRCMEVLAHRMVSLFHDMCRTQGSK